MIANSKVFGSFADCKSSRFVISYLKFEGDAFIFRIPDIINEFRVLFFVCRDGVEV